jgi:hypothetical protein
VYNEWLLSRVTVPVDVILLLELGDEGVPQEVVGEASKDPTENLSSHIVPTITPAKLCVGLKHSKAQRHSRIEVSLCGVQGKHDSQSPNDTYLEEVHDVIAEEGRRDACDAEEGDNVCAYMYDEKLSNIVYSIEI